MSSNWPVRQHTPHPTPPARKFMRRCDECGLELAAAQALVEISEALTDISNALRRGVTTFDGGQA